MDIKVTKEANVIVVKLSGELDHHECKTFREIVDNTVIKDNFSRIVLDFSDLTFMDSSGLGAIVGRYKLCKSAGGTLVIANCNQSIKRLIELGGLGKIIKIYKTTEAAITHIVA